MCVLAERDRDGPCSSCTRFVLVCVGCVGCCYRYRCACEASGTQRTRTNSPLVCCCNNEPLHLIICHCVRFRAVCVFWVLVPRCFVLWAGRFSFVSTLFLFENSWQRVVTMSAKRKKAPLSVSVTEPAAPAGNQAQVQLSWEGVKAVQKKIERCLELYMTQVRRNYCRGSGRHFALLTLYLCANLAVGRNCDCPSSAVES